MLLPAFEFLAHEKKGLRRKMIESTVRVVREFGSTSAPLSARLHSQGSGFNRINARRLQLLAAGRQG